MAKSSKFKLRQLSKYELLKTSWSHQSREFFNRSNLHGVRFISEKGRPFHEKFLWFGFIIVVILISLVIMSSLWEKFQTTPTITGLNTDFHTWDVLFPSITICAKNPTDDQFIEQFVFSRWGKYVNDSDYDYYMRFVQTVGSLSFDNFRNVGKYAQDPAFSEVNLEDVMKNVVRKCDNWLEECYWKGEVVKCCDMFFPTLTEVGFCYSFNSKYLHSEFFSGNNETEKVHVTSKFIHETDSDLSMSFNAEDVRKNPITIYIHSVAEKVTVDALTFHVWTRRIGRILFSPKETYTTEDARQLSIEQRHCVFPDEIPLLTDDVYTFGACTTECRMRIVSERCHCVPFFYPEIGEFRHCSWTAVDCIILNLHAIQNTDCQCELPCFNTVYDIEKLEEIRKNDDPDSPIEISFISWPMTRFKRDVLFGWVDLFVSFGGIAGSLLGFSVCSAVEIIYFFTLRVLCMAYREKHKLEKLRLKCDTMGASVVDLSLEPYIVNNLKRQGTLDTVAKLKPDVTLPYLP